MADATDLKSVLVKTGYGFESHHRHSLESRNRSPRGIRSASDFLVKLDDLGGHTLPRSAPERIRTTKLLIRREMFGKCFRWCLPLCHGVAIRCGTKGRE